MVSTRGDKIWYQGIPKPRPPVRVVLENVWQVQHDNQSSKEQSCAERDLFKIDLRVQGVPQNAVLEDQGRAPKIQDVVHTLRTQSRTESVITDLNKTNSVRSVRNPKRPSKTWERSGRRNGRSFYESTVPVLRQVLARRTLTLHLRNMFKTIERTEKQDEGII